MSSRSEDQKGWNFRQIGQNFLNDEDEETEMLEEEGEQSGSGASKRPRIGSNSPTRAVSAEGSQSPTKRQRIDSGSSSSHAASAESSEDLFQSKYFTHHSIRYSRIPKFALTDVVSTFTMQPMIDEPIEQLIEAIDSQIKMAISETEKMNEGRKVQKIQLLLFGRGLDDPVTLPLREIEQNSAEVLVNELERLGQSEDAEENIDKRTLLISYPMKLMITCVTPPAGAGKNQEQISFTTKNFDANEHFGYNYKQQIDVKWQTTDSYCLFYALVLAQRHCETKIVKELEKRNEAIPQGLMNKKAFACFKDSKDRVRKEALELMVAAKIPFRQKVYGIEHLAAVQAYWDEKYDAKFRIFAFEHAPEIPVRAIWRNDVIRPFNIYIFLKDNHWVAIKKVNRFFPCMGKKWCNECQCSYDRGVFHRVACKARCYFCSRVGFGHPCPITEEFDQECDKCHREFFNESCFNAHKTEVCHTWRRCTECHRVYLFDAKVPHKCGSTFCKRCNVNHDKRGCFVQKLKLQKKDYRILVYDFETRQNEKLDEQDERTRLHHVNYVSARVTCTRCEDNGPTEKCQICGPKRQFDWSEADGDDCIVAFTEWILTAFDNKFQTLIFAHNAARFDSHFVFNYLMATGRRPEPSMIGLKIYEFSIKNGPKHSKLLFRDSYLLMSVPLAALPATFGLDVQPKEHFPHLFNRPENYNIHLPHLPPMEDYCPDTMSEAECMLFKAWYNDNAGITPFFLPDALRDYCRNDTEILLKAILTFRRIFITNVTKGKDPLPKSPTLAKLCLNIYTAMFMEADSIGICPERGYERNDRASVLAIRYLEYRELRDGIQIQHAGNGLEFRYKNYKLDGWIPKQRKCIEILGCFYHGCLKCYSATDELVDNKTAMDLNEQTRKRIADLRRPDAGGNTIEVEEIWECEIREEMKRVKKNAIKEIDDFDNEDVANGEEELAQLKVAQKMKEFFDDMGREKGPIDPRKAFHGGRTGPLALQAKVGEGMEISVFDIISLYPYINYSCEYPVGHPEIIVPSETHVNWTNPEEIQQKGLLKVRIIPPRGLQLPVIPMKMDQRLLFACCYKCARQFEKSNTRVNHQCRHSDRERAFVSTVTHLELKEALVNGYKVDRFWRAWHYKRWSKQLFTGYVNHFLALKVQASGWPAECQTEEQKTQFLEMYKSIGVKIDPEKMHKNPGLRFIAKICLNSLWGKFGQRNTLGKNQVIRDPAEFFNLFYDHKQQINRIMRVSDEAIRVQSMTKTDFIAENPASNIVISLWTTSAARLVLYKYMRDVMQMPGAKLLYTDTDSIIALHPKGIYPVKTGQLLGDMQREYEQWDILEFVSGGAKQYGLHMKSRKNGEEKFVLRIRGITLDQKNGSQFQFGRFRQMVLDYGKEKEAGAYFSYQRIQARANSQIITREMIKKYMPVLQKGLVAEDLTVYPFGYQ